jgi:hypothetical protein
MKNIFALVCMTLLVTGLAVAADPAKDETPSGTAVKGGGSHPAVEGTAWVVYDDGIADTDTAAYFLAADAFGNKFTSSWGTFYCDQVSAYVVSHNGGIFLTYWDALNTAGTSLVNYNWVSVTLPGTTASTWWLADGSTTPIDWIGNPTSAWVNTAFLGNDFNTNDVLGVDATAPHHGFSVTSYTGPGYQEGSFNAMIRARFNGEAVPVELMTFTAE